MRVKKHIWKYRSTLGIQTVTGSTLGRVTGCTDCVEVPSIVTPYSVSVGCTHLHPEGGDSKVFRNVVILPQHKRPQLEYSLPQKLKSHSQTGFLSSVIKSFQVNVGIRQ